MRKIFMLAAGLALTLTACQKDEGLVSDGADYQTITVAIPQSMQTRATADDFGDGSLVDRCLLQVYRNNQPYGEQLTATVTGKTATFNLRLVTSQTYDFVFWADCSTGDHYATEDLTNITVKGDYTGNNDEFDAFTGNLLGYNVTGSFQEKITLRRPFGQLNVKTLDLAAIPDPALKPTQVKVAFSAVPTSFNAQTGLVGEQTAAVEYTADVLSENGDLTVDYIWAPVEEAALADFAITFYNGATEISTNGDFKNIPVRRNYRTNVSGNLLTKQGTFNVVIDPIFETPDIDAKVVDVASAEELISALNDPEVATIHVESDIDLSAATVEELTFSTHKTFDIEAGNTIQLGNKNWLTAEAGLTLTGGGTIDNTSADNSDLVEGSNHYQKSLIHVTGGECLIDGVTLINDPDYHWHSSVSSALYNSSAIAYWNDAEVTIKNAHIVSGEFTVCGMGRGGANTSKVTLVNSYFESTSSNVHNGTNWAYAMRLFGSEVVIEDCEVKGIQGAVSIEECENAEIRSGKFYTVNTPGKKDAFYPLYITGSAVVTITGGEFIGANDWSSRGLAEGTSAVVSGDNDTGRPSGNVILKGGKFSGKAYNHVFNSVYEPDSEYKWQAIENDPSGLKWAVVAK